MQHKLSAAARTSSTSGPPNTSYSQPKRRGLFITPAGTDIIGAMPALNKELYQTRVQFVKVWSMSYILDRVQVTSLDGVG